MNTLMKLSAVELGSLMEELNCVWLSKVTAISFVVIVRKINLLYYMISFCLYGSIIKWLSSNIIFIIYNPLQN